MPSKAPGTSRRPLRKSRDELHRVARALGRDAARDHLRRNQTEHPPSAEGCGEATDLPPPPLTVHEVADYLGVSRDVVRELLRTKKLRGMKVGGHWRVSPVDLAAYVMRKLERE
jgi:excisionase family DNA binding protein